MYTIIVFYKSFCVVIPLRKTFISLIMGTILPFEHKIIVIKTLNIISIASWVLVTLIIILNFNLLKIYMWSSDLTNHPIIVGLLLLGLLLLLIMSYNTEIKNIIAFVIFLIISIINIVSLVNIILWIIKTPEGLLNYKIFQITKIASYETKLHTYLMHISLITDTIQDPSFKQYAEKLLLEYLPQKAVLNATLSNIQELAQNQFAHAKALYEKSLELVKIKPTSDNKNLIHYIQIGGVIISYYFWGDTMMQGFKYTLKLFKNYEKDLVVQENLIKRSVENSLDAAQATLLIKNLSNQVNGLTAQIDLLTKVVKKCALTTDIAPIHGGLKTEKYLLKHLYNGLIPHISNIKAETITATFPLAIKSYLSSTL